MAEVLGSAQAASSSCTSCVRTFAPSELTGLDLDCCLLPPMYIVRMLLIVINYMG